MEAETVEQMQARHRRELKELQGRITSKKKNATKKTRKGVNDECAELERQVREKQAGELAALSGGDAQDEEPADEAANDDDTLAGDTAKLNIQQQGSEDQGSQREEQQETTTTQQQGGAGGGGKKRNRQKERLARRAAEQEAAAIRAEEEASNMTDHRALESEYMKKTFESKGLVQKDIAPDGHCLFSAVADQLRHVGVAVASEGEGKGDGEGDEPEYKVVRRRATGYMAAHEDDFAPFLEEDNFQAYLARMRDTAEWGGQLELMALARAYGVGICVVQDGRIERLGDVDEDGDKSKVLWLAYYRHGYGLGEHYNSLRKK
ncbi:OTU protein [Lecanicillium sp. MT-2017a]|nr:OTU protein [Lecanicillium sp. MT-2017a]